MNWVPLYFLMLWALVGCAQVDPWTTVSSTRAHDCHSCQDDETCWPSGREGYTCMAAFDLQPDAQVDGPIFDLGSPDAQLHDQSVRRQRRLRHRHHGEREPVEDFFEG